MNDCEPLVTEYLQAVGAVDSLQQGTYLGAMGQHAPRTAADEIADAFDDLAEARQALQSAIDQLDGLTVDEGNAGVAYQIRRNAKIAAAKLDDAERHARESNRLQLSSVS